MRTRFCGGLQSEDYVYAPLRYLPTTPLRYLPTRVLGTFLRNCRPYRSWSFLAVNDRETPTEWLLLPPFGSLLSSRVSPQSTTSRMLHNPRGFGTNRTVLLRVVKVEFTVPGASSAAFIPFDPFQQPLPLLKASPCPLIAHPDAGKAGLTQCPAHPVELPFARGAVSGFTRFPVPSSLEYGQDRNIRQSGESPCWPIRERNLPGRRRALSDSPSPGQNRSRRDGRRAPRPRKQTVACVTRTAAMPRLPPRMWVSSTVRSTGCKSYLHSEYPDRVE